MQAGTSGKAAETVNSWCFCSGDNQVLATTHTLTLACTCQNPLSNHKYLQVPTGTNKYPENSKLLQCAQTVNSRCFCWVDHSHRLLNTDTCMNPPVHWWHLYVPTRPQKCRYNYQKVPTDADKYPWKLKTTWGGAPTHKYSDWKRPFKIHTGPVLLHSVGTPSLTSMAFSSHQLNIYKHFKYHQLNISS